MPFSHVTIAMSPGWGGLLRHATFDENGVLTKSQFWGIPRISRQLTVFLTLSNPTDSMRTLYFRWEVGIHAEVNLPPLATLQSTLVDSVVG